MTTHMMKSRFLGKIQVSAIGLGCMGFSHGYGAIPPRNEAINAICHAVEQGCTHFDTAEGYGKGDNERLVGEALKAFRKNIVLATKFRVNDRDFSVEEQIRAHLAESMQRLGTDYIDLYYQHRQTAGVEVEKVAEVMAKLIAEGQIRGWGLSQVSAKLIERAHDITPLSAIQSEYSMMERMFEADVLPLCQKSNIGFVAFSPLAGGFLSGKITTAMDYSGDDVRKVISRYFDENISANQPLADMIARFAQHKNATPAQIALAWMLAKWPCLTPIPGSKKSERIDENLGAANVELTADEMQRLNSELDKITIHGNRTDEAIASLYKK